MTLEEIKRAIAEGKTVHWASALYTVIPCTMADGTIEQYLIKCKANGHCWGLTKRDGVTLTESRPGMFYIAHEPPPQDDTHAGDLFDTNAHKQTDLVDAIRAKEKETP